MAHARDLAVLVLVEIAEAGLRERRVRLLDRLELIASNF
jgi:hypothetical protein